MRRKIITICFKGQKQRKDWLKKVGCLGLLAVFSLYGCSGSDSQEADTKDPAADPVVQNPQGDSDSETPSKAETYSSDPQYKQAYDFVMALQKNDMKAAASCLLCDSRCLISPEEAQTVIQKSDYTDLIGKTGKYSLIEFYRLKETRYRLTFKIDNDQYSVETVANEDGKTWRVYLPGLVYVPYGLRIPGETDVYWDSVQISSVLGKPVLDENRLQSRYDFYCLKNTESVVTIHTSAFGDLAERIQTKAPSTVYEPARTLKKDLATDIVRSMQNLYDQMHADVAAGIEKSEFYTKFFSSNIPQTDANRIYDQIKESFGQKKYSAVEMIDAALSSEEDGSVERTNVCKVTFEYRIRRIKWKNMVSSSGTVWTEDRSDSETTSDRAATLYLIHAGSSWKIFSLPEGCSLFDSEV